MTEFPTILLERVTRALVGVRNSRNDPHRRSRAAMAAADFYFATREAMVRREEQAALREELELSVTIATRERSARYELQQFVRFKTKWLYERSKMRHSLVRGTRIVS